MPRYGGFIGGLMALAMCTHAAHAASVGAESPQPSRLGHSATRTVLPVYLEDSHAGSFYWLAEHLDLDESCRLLLFDAHSDASGIFNSDSIRARMRRVASVEERRRVLEDWRKRGVVQCYDWIEPLMPSPIREVIWVRPAGSGGNEADQGDAREALDGHQEAAPREGGSLAERYRVQSMEELVSTFRDEGPLVISIDLDSFAGMEPGKQAEAFERVWRFCSERKNLRAITLAVSRSYLSSDEEAHRLVNLAIRGVLSLPTASLQFEPYRVVANDRSSVAEELRAAGREVPVYQIEGAPEELISLCLARRERITVSHDRDRWERLLREWESALPVPSLEVRGRTPSTDGVWRLPAGEGGSVTLVESFHGDEKREVSWFALVPEYRSCNLTATGQEENGFALKAPARPRWREVRLEGGNGELSLAKLASYFDPGLGTGSVRIFARVRYEGATEAIRETQAMEIRRWTGEGFRAGLTEQFGLPYLFDGGELRGGGETGPETGWGADCANYLVYAWRRQGLRIPWCNPKQLRIFLDEVASRARPGEVKIPPDDVARGVVVHLGNHVAAVWEDRGVPGVLDGEDVLIHQLEGFPERITLKDLLVGRPNQWFDVLRVRSSEPDAVVVFGGDVMLGRTVGERIERGENPFAGIAPALARSDMNVVNLESVISGRGSPTVGRKYHFRAPSKAVDVLAEAGVDVVSLANNHAMDYGLEALSDCISMLEQKSIATPGVFIGGRKGLLSRRFAETEVEMALLVLDATGSSKPPGVMLTAEEREELKELLESARTATHIVAFVHWGEENTACVTDEQRELARWLIDHGVDLIVGTHPHVVQELDSYRGRPIAYSLGNLVFDGAPTVKGWSEGVLLRVGLSGARSVSVETLPVRLDVDGFPRMEN